MIAARLARQSAEWPGTVRSCHAPDAGRYACGSERHGRPTRPSCGRRRCTSASSPCPRRWSRRCAGIFDVMNAFALHGPPERRSARSRRSRRDRGRGGRPARAGQRRADRRAARDRRRRGDRHRDRAVGAARAGEAGRRAATRSWSTGCARMHERGALLCSACSGIFLLAETGLFDGKDATVHFGYARAFAAAYPEVPIHPERVLVISGAREELVSSGASTTWHDLVLYLIARHAGATAAQDGGALVRAAVAPGRARALHRLRGQAATTATPRSGARSSGWRRTSRSPTRWRRWSSAPGSPSAPSSAASRARPGSPDRLRAAPAHRGRQAPARAHRRAGRRDQLAGRLRGRRPSSAACSSARPAWRRAPTAGASGSRGDSHL